MEFFKVPNIDFIGQKKKAYIFSCTFIGIGILSMLLPVYPGRGLGLNLSIDFVGGTAIQLQFQKPVVQDLGTIRSIVSDLGYGGPSVKTIGTEGSHEVQIIVKSNKDISAVATEMEQAISKRYAENPFEIRRQEKIGPKVGSELAEKAVIALLLSFLAIIVYVAFRFNLPFGVASVIALVHDAMVVVTVFAVFNLEFSLQIVAALLTIIGFSINDTIVIFDRVRENMASGAGPKRTFEEKVNRAINETLTRTVNTSLTVLVTVVAIYAVFFGTGDVLSDFSLAMICGIISGTYSTVYVATALACDWNRRWPIKS